MITENVVIPDKPFEYLGINRDIDEWRLHQHEVVEKILKSNKRFIILEAPTGSGKSLIGVMVAKLMNAKTYYLTSTKDLQNQLVNDFKFFVHLKGRNNFKCILDEKRPCNLCPYSSMGVECPRYKDCSYVIHKQLAKYAQFVVTNYSMFLTNQTFVGDFDRADLIICDEAHTVESELMKFVGVKFTYKFFHDIGLTFPGREDLVFERLNNAVSTMERYIGDTRESSYMDLITGKKLPHPYAVSKIERYEKNIKKIKFLFSVYDNDGWIVDYHRDGYHMENSYIEFKPVIPDNFAEYIYGWGDKILFMSATFPPVDIFCKGLGIDKKDVYMIKMPSVFNKENRPIIYHPVGRLSRRSWESSIGNAIMFIDKFINKHSNEKIVIHCVSYKNLKAVLTAIESDDIKKPYGMRLIYHENTEDRQSAIDDFKECKTPALFLSPSIETGVDFKYDMCHYQVILKVPYLNLGDKQIMTRMELDKKWYLSQAVMRLVQASGRIVRADDDWGITYVIDECFADIVKKNRYMFPEWYLDAIAVEV